MKFTTLSSQAIILKEENVDTDAIIPARFLKATTREGFGDNLFRDWRYDEHGDLLPSIFNEKESKDKHILIVEKDFGIGSSREHAAWALYDYGFRVVIGSTFGDIFKNNALKNNLLIVSLKPTEITSLFQEIGENPNKVITINLEKQIVSLPDNTGFSFDIDPFRKRCLIEGVDEIGYILSKEKDIKTYEEKNFLRHSERSEESI